MNEPTRDHARLLVAAVRVLAHREQAPPEPDGVAELLRLPPEAVRLDVARLGELGVLRLVQSAYALHLEVGDETLIEQLPEAADAPAMDDALAEFNRRKQEEAERMSRLFAEGDHERQKRERLLGMEDGLRSFKKKRPRNPFGDDD